MEKLTFEALFEEYYHHLHCWERGRIDDEYDDDFPENFWDEYNELAQDYEYAEEDSSEMYESLATWNKFMGSKLKNWYASEISALTKSLLSKKASNIKDSAEILLQYLAMAYIHYEDIIDQNKKEIEGKPYNSEKHFKILNDEFYSSIIYDTFWAVHDKFIGKLDSSFCDPDMDLIKKYSEKGKGEFDEWATQNSLDADLSKPWTKLMILLRIAEAIYFSAIKDKEDKFMFGNIMRYILNATASSFQNSDCSFYYPI